MLGRGKESSIVKSETGISIATPRDRPSSGEPGAKLALSHQTRSGVRCTVAAVPAQYLLAAVAGRSDPTLGRASPAAVLSLRLVIPTDWPTSPSALAHPT